MKLITSIFLTLILLAMGQSAFAQTPKDVTVVNGPVNPASVIVENGILNPVPVVDVASRGEPFHAAVFSLQDFATRATAVIEIPVGKLLIVTAINATYGGDADSSFNFRLEYAFDCIGSRCAKGTFSIAPDGTYSETEFSGATRAVLHKEFNHLHASPIVRIIAERYRPNGTGQSVAGGLATVVWGYLVDAPSQ